jgi:lysophospholipase L1-like esterase
MSFMRTGCTFLLLASMVGRLIAPQGCAQAPEATQPSAHNFARWEKEIAAFEAADRASPPPSGAILFIGSSTIRLWKTLARDFPEHRVINRGFGGSEIVDSTHFADRVIIPCEPRIVLLRAGGNDIHNGKSPQQVFHDYKQFVAKVHAKLPQTKIVFISLCPAISRWNEAAKNKELNMLVEQWSRDKPYLGYIESYDISLSHDGQPRPELFLDDKLHLNEQGYKLLVERVRLHLSK